MWLEKKNEKKKKMKDNTNIFISMTFEFVTDACFLLYCLLKLYCWKFVGQFDMRKSGILV